MQRKRVAILISGRGSNMAALTAAASEPGFPAAITLVVSNRADAAGLQRAAAAGIATLVIDHKPFGKDRAAFEHALDDKLSAARIDIICLAGFMRLLTPWFVGKWAGRMINIHPALLPAFKGLDTHERALAAGVKLHGASVHFVTAETDSGPLIVQAAVPVHDRDTPDTLAARVLTAEHRIYPLALRWLAEERLAVTGNRCKLLEADTGNAMLIAPKPFSGETDTAST